MAALNDVVMLTYWEGITSIYWLRKFLQIPGIWCWNLVWKF